MMSICYCVMMMLDKRGNKITFNSRGWLGLLNEKAAERMEISPSSSACDMKAYVEEARTPLGSVKGKRRV